MSFILGKIKDGQIVVKEKYYGDDLKKGEGKMVIIEVDPKDAKTKAQLGYLFGVVFKIIGATTGCTPFEIYELMLKKLPEITKYHKVARGKTLEFTKRLSMMNRQETGRFIDACLNFFRTNEVTRDWPIPEPDPDYQWK